MKNLVAVMNECNIAKRRDIFAHTTELSTSMYLFQSQINHSATVSVFRNFVKFFPASSNFSHAHKFSL